MLLSIEVTGVKSLQKSDLLPTLQSLEEVAHRLPFFLFVFCFF